MATGVFSLKKVYKKQYQNIKDKNFSSWPESAIYGYYGGGSITAPTIVCTIDRLDFSTETVSVPGPKLSQAKENLATVSNSSYGYFGGGDTAAFVCTIDRLDFSTETVSVPTPKLSQAKAALAAVSSSSYGYFGGGLTTIRVCTIDRLDFSTETVSVPGPKLSEARYSLAAVSSNSYGYFGGGFSFPGQISIIDRLDFSTETVSVPGPQLSQAKSALAAVSSSSYGYFGGGFVPGVLFSTIDRLDFSTETVWTPSPTTPKLSQAKTQLAATSSSSYGYFGGGFTPAVPGSVCTIDRLDFSTETVTVPTSQLSQSKSVLAAVSGGQSILRGNKTYGYFGGGGVITTPSPISISTIDRLDFSTETVWTPSPTTPKLSEQKGNHASNSNNDYGYFVGGADGATGYSTVDRLDFSNETIRKNISNLLNRSLLSATSSSSYGYFGGGGSFVSTINRLDFSTETIGTIIPKLFDQKNNLSATSSNSYGYFGGGNLTPGAVVSVIDRLDFLTEIVSTPLSNLSLGRTALRATSSNSYGYFSGGSAAPGPTFFSTIDRLDFSTETVWTPSPTTPKLSVPKNNHSAISSNIYGYFGGGSAIPAVGSYVSTIDRLDFSTETVSVPGPKLSQATSGVSAVSNSN